MRRGRLWEGGWACGSVMEEEDRMNDCGKRAEELFTSTGFS